MTEFEFQDFIKYTKELWPRYEPTQAQLDVWWESFRKPDYQRCRRVAAELFKRTKWPEPRLNEILELLRKERGQDTNEDTGFSLELTSQIEREAAADADFLSEWTPQELIDGKAEIIAHEPGMAVFEGMAANGRLWQHFIVERYVMHRAMAYPGKIKAIQRPRQPAELHLPRGIAIDRDEYWKAGPQPRRTGIRSVSNGNEEQKVAQAAKVELQGQG